MNNVWRLDKEGKFLGLHHLYRISSFLFAYICQSFSSTFSISHYCYVGAGESGKSTIVKQMK